jgi:hypothetical protein
LELNRQIDARRLPKDAGVEDLDSQPFELEWLYSPSFEDMVEGWLENI